MATSKSTDRGSSYVKQERRVVLKDRPHIRHNENIKGEWGRTKEEPETQNDNDDKETPDDKKKPDFEPSGLLVSETHIKNDVLLKFVEPPEARLPQLRWRLYMFKSNAELNENSLEPSKIFHLHRQPSYLIGKDPRVCQIYLLHPTISKQHAVLVHRHGQSDKLKPYIMDLESTNGTFLNGKKLEPSRFYELREQDALMFGSSSREYILLEAGSVNVEEINYRNFVEKDIEKKLKIAKESESKTEQEQKEQTQLHKMTWKEKFQHKILNKRT